MNEATAVLYDQRSYSSVARAISRCVARVISSTEPGAASGTAVLPGLASRHSRWRNRAVPSIPASLHSTSSCGGLTKRWNSRRASAPTDSKYSCGRTRLPFDFDILVPLIRMMPWVNSRAKGSRSVLGATSRSASALVKNRAYIRCRMACSMPPMYWSTGSQRSTASASKGALWFHGSAKRRKYHDESTKVSIVSVSRVAGPPQIGQVVCRKPSWKRSGDSPVGRNSTSSEHSSRAARTASSHVCTLTPMVRCSESVSDVSASCSQPRGR